MATPYLVRFETKMIMKAIRMTLTPKPPELMVFKTNDQTVVFIKAINITFNKQYGNGNGRMYFKVLTEFS